VIRVVDSVGVRECRICKGTNPDLPDCNQMQAEKECRKIFEKMFPTYEPSGSVEKRFTDFGLACFEAGRELGQEEGFIKARKYPLGKELR
jgi:hypothetical protein